MAFKVLSGVAAGLALMAVATAAPAYATPSYSFSVSEGLTNGSGFTTTSANPFTGANTASASFTYTGAINFSDTQSQNSGPAGDLNSTFGFSTSNVSNYSGSGTVFQGPTQIANYNTLNGFLGSSGSASNFQYASFYTIDLGVLAAGTILTITHDDGVNVYQAGASLGQTVAGPTNQTTDTVKISNSLDTILYYTRQNGTPSILTVGVPEPMTISVMGMGLLGLCFMRRRHS